MLSFRSQGNYYKIQNKQANLYYYAISVWKKTKYKHEANEFIRLSWLKKNIHRSEV